MVSSWSSQAKWTFGALTKFLASGLNLAVVTVRPNNHESSFTRSKWYMALFAYMRGNGDGDFYGSGGRDMRRIRTRITMKMRMIVITILTVRILFMNTRLLTLEARLNKPKLRLTRP